MSVGFANCILHKSLSVFAVKVAVDAFICIVVGIYFNAYKACAALKGSCADAFHASADFNCQNVFAGVKRFVADLLNRQPLIEVCDHDMLVCTSADTGENRIRFVSADRIRKPLARLLFSANRAVSISEGVFLSLYDFWGA